MLLVKIDAGDAADYLGTRKKYVNGNVREEADVADAWRRRAQKRFLEFDCELCLAVCVCVRLVLNARERRAVDVRR